MNKVILNKIIQRGKFRKGFSSFIRRIFRKVKLIDYCGDIENKTGIHYSLWITQKSFENIKKAGVNHMLYFRFILKGLKVGYYTPDFILYKNEECESSLFDGNNWKKKRNFISLKEYI